MGRWDDDDPTERSRRYRGKQRWLWQCRATQTRKHYQTPRNNIHFVAVRYLAI